ncbi:MAG: hypothetical protein LBV00_06245 [Propionibacteriaceae bacterium]|nr:hypothetical protein [Propionibacteriaceae bacterium]
MTTKRAILHCNSGGTFGMGHLMRSVAIAEEAQHRGWAITLIGAIDSVGVNYAISHCGRDSVVATSQADTPVRLAQAAHQGHAKVVHLDSYVLADAEVPRGPWLLSNIHDGSFGARETDLGIDPNFEAENQPLPIKAARADLMGIRYCPIRQQVLLRRRANPATEASHRVLVMIGGTDPFELGATVTSHLVEADETLRVTLIAPNLSPKQDRMLRRAPLVNVIPFTQDLPALAHQHDAVISAAGTSIWDFLCMGSPMGLLCVVDNQIKAYRRVIAANLAIGLGEPPHRELRQTIAEFARTLHQPTALANMARRGQELVDGRGAERIVSEWENLAELTL